MLNFLFYKIDYKMKYQSRFACKGSAICIAATKNS